MKNAKSKINLLIILNLVIFIFEIYASAVHWCGTDLLFREEGFKIGAGLNMFHWFTIDSNILLAIASAVICGFYIREKMTGKAVSKFAHYFKLIATSATTLTFVVTFFYLLPGSIAIGRDTTMIVANANLFYHVLCPLLALLTVLLEDFKPLKWTWGFAMMIPCLLYAPFYLLGYLFQWSFFAKDFYHFFDIGGGFVVPPIVIAASFLCGFLVIKLNNIQIKNSNK